MQIKIALFGASGRMGQAIASMASQEPDLLISQAIAHPRSSSLGLSLAGVPIIPAFEGKADLFFDVSLAEAFPLSLSTALQIKRPLVIGVTGLSTQQLDELAAASHHIPIFYSPNFSLGMALFRQFSREAAKCFHRNSTADLIETHHAKKRDAPSGSALLIQEDLTGFGKEVRIHSIRSGSVLGEHHLRLNAEEERLELIHTVHSRAIFARGSLLAARFLIHRTPGLYGMDDLIVSFGP